MSVHVTWCLSRVCVCVCVRARVCACVRACVRGCIKEREREREGKRITTHMKRDSECNGNEKDSNEKQPERKSQKLNLKNTKHFG